MRTKFTKHGREYEFTFNLDLIEKAETENPDYSIIEQVQHFAEKPKFSDIKKLIEFTGISWNMFVYEYCFTFQDMLEIVTGCLKEQLGFYTETPQE